MKISSSFITENRKAIGYAKGTGRIETSQYPKEKKAIAIPLVAASEEGQA